MTEFIAIPAITVICYLFAEVYKSVISGEKYKHIPVLCGVVGGIFGVICFVLIPGYIPAENIIVAAAIGIVSGWAATGANQIYKQNS